MNYTYTPQFAGYRDEAGNLLAPTTPEYKGNPGHHLRHRGNLPRHGQRNRVTIAYNTPNLQVSSVTVASGNRGDQLDHQLHL